MIRVKELQQIAGCIDPCISNLHLSISIEELRTIQIVYCLDYALCGLMSHNCLYSVPLQDNWEGFPVLQWPTLRFSEQLVGCQVQMIGFWKNCPITACLIMTMTLRVSCWMRGSRVNLCDQGSAKWVRSSAILREAFHFLDKFFKPRSFAGCPNSLHEAWLESLGNCRFSCATCWFDQLHGPTWSLTA